MQRQRTTTILRGALAGGLLVLAGSAVAAPAALADGGDYGTCCNIIVNVTPPQVTPPNVTIPSVSPPRSVSRRRRSRRRFPWCRSAAAGAPGSPAGAPAR